MRVGLHLRAKKVQSKIAEVTLMHKQNLHTCTAKTQSIRGRKGR